MLFWPGLDAWYLRSTTSTFREPTISSWLSRVLSLVADSVGRCDWLSAVSPVRSKVLGGSAYEFSGNVTPLGDHKACGTATSDVIRPIFEHVDHVDDQ